MKNDSKNKPVIHGKLRLSTETLAMFTKTGLKAGGGPEIPQPSNNGHCPPTDPLPR